MERNNNNNNNNKSKQYEIELLLKSHSWVIKRKIELDLPLLAEDKEYIMFNL